MLRSAQPCAGCGYDLAGLPIAGRCPECGLAIAESLSRATLACAGIGYLRSLDRGLSLVLLMTVLLIVMLTCRLFVVQAILYGAIGFWAIPAISLVVIGWSYGMIFGYAKCLEPCPGVPEETWPSGLCTTIRVTLLALLVVNLLVLLLELLGPPVGPGVPLHVLGSSHHADMVAPYILSFRLLWLSLLAVYLFSSARYVEWLATRLPSDTLATQARPLAWLLPILAIAGVCIWIVAPIAALTIHWYTLKRLQAHIRLAIISRGPPVDVS